MHVYAALSADDVVACFENVLQHHFHDEVIEAVAAWPSVRALDVDYDTLDRAAPDLADALRAQPNLIDYGLGPLRAQARALRDEADLEIRLVRLPEDLRVPVHAIRAEHLGRLVPVRGIIKSTTKVRFRPEHPAWRCSLCGCIVKTNGASGPELDSPEVCHEEQGGCGRSPRKWDLDETQTTWEDQQILELQEAPEDLQNGLHPSRFRVYARGDLVGHAQAGARVVVNMVVRAEYRRRQGRVLAEHDVVGYAHSLEPEEDTARSDDISPEDEDRIQELARNPAIFDMLRAALAPGVHGLETQKDALVLALFGGVSKPLEGGTRIRGDIHVLLVGDPGTAKSQLLRSAAQLAPRAVLTSAKSSSGAGLTAAAVRDAVAENAWTLEAGALVIADGGVCVVDELDKMRGDDRDALHEAMEQQEINFAKAGIRATLQSRCGVISAANPKLGRFDPYADFVDQFELPPSLLSRFDLVFAIQDLPDRDRDTDLARAILSSTRSGQARAIERMAAAGTPFNGEIGKLTAPQALVDRDLLRRYIHYARTRVSPLLSEEASDYLVTYYGDVRAASSRTVPLTARHLEAAVRLSEASARVRLSWWVTIDDARRAVRLLTAYLSRLGVDPSTGTIDADAVGGTAQSQQERIRAVSRAIQEGASRTGGTPYGRVLELCAAGGLSELVVRESLDHLKRKGLAYEPTKHNYRLRN